MRAGGRSVSEAERHDAGVAEDPRPWERPGGVRRDCEPHRGRLLHVLGVLSLVCGMLSGCLAPAILALPLGVAV